MKEYKNGQASEGDPTFRSSKGMVANPLAQVGGGRAIEVGGVPAVLSPRAVRFGFGPKAVITAFILLTFTACLPYSPRRMIPARLPAGVPSR